ncbi:acyltransferase family protein [Paenibacillus chartarius]|uniref:Acyltransferase family protein n=1 Tax=Paenibacillus chartarius TaxID=747481 RepID=A0ABV6DSS8_9BACL
MDMTRGRDSSIDIFKGLLVIGMIFCHVLQFFSDDRLYPEVRYATSLFNLITFPGFVFSFGFVSQLAYYGKRLRDVYTRMGINALKMLAAFYISGTCYRILAEGRELSGELLLPILLLDDIPGWSEFLVSFALFTAAGIVLFHPLRWLTARKRLFWAVTAALLLTTLIDYGSIKANQLGLLAGSRQFASFPVLQYMPFYLIGVYFACHKVSWSWRVFAGAVAATGMFAAIWLTSGELPERFPPSAAWIAGPSLLLYGYLLLAAALSKRGWPTAWLHTLGRNVLVYLLLSNIMIFAMKRTQPDLPLTMPESAGMTVAIMLIITFLLKLVTQPKTKGERQSHEYQHSKTGTSAP